MPMVHASSCKASPIGCWPAAIPKHIYLAFKTKARVPRFVLASWRDLNPGFRVKLFDDDDCAEFVRKTFGAGMAAVYRSIPSGPIRGDLWRLLMILSRGGVYVDIDAEPIQSLESAVEPTDVLVTSGSLSARNLNPHLLISRAGDPLLNRTLQRMLHSMRLQSLDPQKNFSFHGATICTHMWAELNATYGRIAATRANRGIALPALPAKGNSDGSTYRFLREVTLLKPRVVKATTSREGVVICYNKWNRSVWDMCLGGPRKGRGTACEGGFTDAYQDVRSL